ncbi:FAD-dependent thymidylate synthase, partial [Pseudomonas aeruginosa]|uniref:FAD-dependent thymidylate synthase n=1 Tax=Pseudomonas aeruginosa TaxID=287 RepID=UPI0034578DEC
DIMKVRLVSKTVGIDGKSPAELIAYAARVSNPGNQDNPNIIGLLKYCFKHGHVSIFEMADFTFEITTSRAIAAQILRHRHFNY